MARRKKSTDVITGVFDNISSEEYHNGKFKDYIGHSGLVKLLQSPAHFKAFKDEHETTPAMEFGTAAHIVMLENPHKRIAIADFDSKKSKAYKEFYDQSIKDGFEIVVLKDEWDKLMRMREVFFENEYVKNLIVNGKCELTGLWIDDAFEGIKCKIRFDYWINEPSLTIIVDYKTTKNSSTEKFAYTVDEFGYDIQGYFYIYGAKKVFSPRSEKIQFILIAQEYEKPFNVNVLPLSDKYLEIGRIKTNKALTIYWNCLENPALFKKGYQSDKLYSLEPPISIERKWL